MNIFNEQGKQNKQINNYLTIFKNQILCLKADGDCYCNCATLKFNGKCEVRLFIKRFEERHEIAAQHYLHKEKEEL